MKPYDPNLNRQGEYLQVEIKTLPAAVLHIFCIITGSLYTVYRQTTKMHIHKVLNKTSLL